MFYCTRSKCIRMLESGKQTEMVLEKNQKRSKKTNRLCGVGELDDATAGVSHKLVGSSGEETTVCAEYDHVIVKVPSA